MRPRIARSVPQSVRQPRPGDSRAHLAVIRALPCVVCGGPGGDPHHLLNVHDGAPKGVGRRNEDRWAIPVCRKCHDAAHAAGGDEAWFMVCGINARQLAEALWACRLKPEYEAAARRVVERAKQVRM